MINSSSAKQRKKQKSPKNFVKMFDKKMVVDTAKPFDEIVANVIDRAERGIYSFVIAKNYDQKDKFENRFDELHKKQRKFINVLVVTAW